jgi:hypothetical protein
MDEKEPFFIRFLMVPIFYGWKGVDVFFLLLHFDLFVLIFVANGQMDG